MSVEVTEVLGLLVLGFLAGTAGGLVGLGGSIVMIPALTLLMHREQHLAQAAAMIVNFFIAVPSVIRHARAGTVPRGILEYMMPAAILFILLGVAVSNRLDGEVLKRLFGFFLLYAMIMKIFKMYRERGQTTMKPKRGGPASAGVVGAGMGFSAGLLGIGGGPIAVPLLQHVCRLPLRASIAASSAVMCLTSLVGATYKNLTLSHLTTDAGVSLGLHFKDSVTIAAWVAPTAAIGALYGAGLTHRLPLFWVRLAFVILMGCASLMMLDVF